MQNKFVEIDFKTTNALCFDTQPPPPPTPAVRLVLNAIQSSVLVNIQTLFHKRNDKVKFFFARDCNNFFVVVFARHQGILNGHFESSMICVAMCKTISCSSIFLAFNKRT